MIPVMLLLIVGGIGLSQAVCDPRQVTLRWLRLGGIIALALTAAAATAMATTGLDEARGLWPAWGATLAAVVVQLMAAQLGKTRLQRLAAGLTLAAASAAVYLAVTAPQFFPPPENAPDFADQAAPPGIATHPLLLLPVIAVSAGLLGGYLMTMLLGHAYLTAGNEMTQTPFRRLVLAVALLLALRALAVVVLGLLPYWQAESQPGMARMWSTVMIAARVAVGLLAPAAFTYMTWDCVRRHSNQSATGILYVASVLIFMGEGIALALWGSTHLAF